MRFSVLLSLGPEEFEMNRAASLLRWLFHFEANHVSAVVISDDARQPRDFGFITTLAPQVRTILLHSPRRLGGDAWRGGLATNYFSGFARAFDEPEIAMCLVLDSDAFVMRPFFHRAKQIFSQDSRLGILGSCFEYDPRGNSVPPSTWRRNLAKWNKLIRLRKRPFFHVETALYGRNKKIRQLLHLAAKNGWRLGANAQGGAFLISRRVYEKCVHERLFEDPFLWQNTDLSYDVIFSLMCVALGFRIKDDNRANGIFGVQYRGLPFPPAQLVERDYALVHSLKMPSHAEEIELRDSLIKLISNARPAVS
jgi:hypothetical protein